MTPLIKFIPQGTRIDFMGKRAAGLLLSGLLLLASVVSLGVQGLSFGIDFAGGILIEARTPQPANLPEIRGTLGSLNLGDVGVTTFGEDGRDVAIRIGIQQGGDEAQTAALNRVREALGADVDYRRVEVVGPKVGDELVRDGALAVGLSLLAIAVYIWFRFEWQFAVGGLLALVHDIIVTLGLFSLLQLDFDLTTVAALLTIAGYSINDTVVAYDRVRENLRRYKKMDLPELINRSLNEVLSRTLLTSGTTLLAVLALFLFGGSVLRGFSFALIWGITIGTFSSLFVAMPVLLYLDVRRDEDEEEGGTNQEAQAEQP
ncbi:protein translocase subunit SecF [Novispirillum sp. DQ9]|uniref:protein translocase subunit SecF n=1 Tax=Novispirillum sp. DQ9 TaxID=3398612 RepID=UPI003C7C63CB